MLARPLASARARFDTEPPLKKEIVMAATGFTDGAKVKGIALAMLVMLVLAGAPTALGQTSDEVQALRKAVDALTDGQQRIERELAEIKALLRARPAAAPDDDPKTVVLSLDGDPFKGQRTAKLVLVDFTDYQ
jgi:hypothetical protein